MYVASRTAKNLKVALAVVLAYLVVVAPLAWFYPAAGVSFAEAYLRWAAGIPATVALWFSIEWLATRVLGLRFWTRLSSSARIVLLVVVIVAIVVTAMVLHNWWLVQGAA
jgi:hypothetical protein